MKQKSVPYTMTGVTNPDSIETGTITENEILTTHGTTKGNTTITATKTATTS